MQSFWHYLVCAVTWVWLFYFNLITNCLKVFCKPEKCLNASFKTVERVLEFFFMRTPQEGHLAKITPLLWSKSHFTSVHAEPWALSASIKTCLLSVTVKWRVGNVTTTEDIGMMAVQRCSSLSSVNIPSVHWYWLEWHIACKQFASTVPESYSSEDLWVIRSSMK